LEAELEHQLAPQKVHKQQQQQQREEDNLQSKQGRRI
jgi:hypothetical protein